MPHFLNEKRSYSISTSYKVMYSTLCNQTALVRPRTRQLFGHAWKTRFGLED